MNQMSQLSTVIECRKLASYYRTRTPGTPMNRSEQAGVSALLGGIADLIESLNMSAKPRTDNVIELAKAQRG